MRFLTAISALAFWAGAFWAGPAESAALVKVGGYDFPPFVENGSARATGITLDLIAAMNAAQTQYRFEFEPVSARRRYSDLSEGRFDVMFFESPLWGWQGLAEQVDFTKVFLRGGERFIALAVPGRGQEYFASLDGKGLVGILGYHYAFAGFDADPRHLSERFDIKLVGSHRSSIDLVLAGRRDVAVVTNSYLSLHLKQNPESGTKMLVSDHYDQTYEHRILVRRGGPVSTAIMQDMLDRLAQGGGLADIWRKWGVSGS